MNAQVSVVLVATGMITPLGDSAATSIAAIKGGISAYSASQYISHRGTPMILAQVPGEVIAPLVAPLQAQKLSPRRVRMLQLAGTALQQTVAETGLSAPCPLYLAAPESLPNLPATVGDEFLGQLAVQANIELDMTHSRVFAAGRAAGLAALQAGIGAIQAGLPVCLVGGVDSYMEATLLGQLDADNRVLGENASGGFAPAEGAGFIMLVSPQHAQRFPNAQVFHCGIGLAQEQGHRYADAVCLGDGLATATHRALANCGGRKVSRVYASFNGEALHSKEYGVACIRHHAAFAADAPLVHPADCLGDMGAAIAPLLLAMALEENNMGCSLILTTSEQAPRAAMWVAAQS